nr:MAG: PB2 [Byreldi virus]
MRNTPLCNLKTVQRRAKNIKDSNPLSSMQASFSLMYPISVDVVKAKNCGIPRQFLSEADTHNHGRRLCKIGAIEWYVDNAAATSESTDKAIDVLYRAKRKEVKEHYENPWSSSSVRFGTVKLIRQMVPTREVSFKVPSANRKAYLLATMMPDLTIDYGNLDPVILEELATLRDLNLDAKLAIQSQLRILMNMMDPKFRYMPCVDGWLPDMNRCRYVYASDHHMIVMPPSHVQRRVDYTDFLINLGSAIHFLLANGWKADRLKQDLLESTFRGVSMRVVLESEQETKHPYHKLCLAIAGIEIEDYKMIDDFSFVSVSGNVVNALRVNAGGCKMGYYVGEERVQIKNNEMMGLFRRSDDTLYGMSVTKCSTITLKRALVAIAVFLKKGFLRSKQQRMRNIIEECRSRYSQAPWEVVGMEKSTWTATAIKGINHENLKFVDQMEETIRRKYKANIVDSSIMLENGKVIELGDKPRATTLPEEFKSTAHSFRHFVAPKLRLFYRIQFYLDRKNRDKLYSNIKNSIFCWENQSIMSGINAVDRPRIAGIARSWISQGIQSDLPAEFLAFWYCFAGGNKISFEEGETDSSFVWFSTYKIDLNMNEGTCVLNENKLQIMGFLVRPHTILLDKVAQVFLPGYKLVTEEVEEPLVMTYKKAIKNIKKIRHGTYIKIFLFGMGFTFVRDGGHQISVSKTMAVRMSNLKLPVTLRNMLKRPLDDSETDPGEGPSKLPRLDSSVDLTLGLDDDDDFDFDCEDL